MRSSSPHKPIYILLTCAAMAMLYLTAIQTSHAFVADDANSFDTGGDPPVHSWTGSLTPPNPHNEVFTNNGAPISPLERIENRSVAGVYEDTDECDRPPNRRNPNALKPDLSICRLQDMARQIHAVVENYVLAFMLMTEQFTAVMMHQVFGIGTIMDADLHIDTQREIATLTAQAHKDYHPSEQLCRFGTFIRSVADAQSRVNLNKQAFNKIMMTGYLGPGDSPEAQDFLEATQSRIDSFKTIYCDPADNNQGLDKFCTNPGSDEKRYNNDIDYQRTLNAPLTINTDFTNGNTVEDINGGGQDMIALARNLYWPAPMEGINEDQLERKGDKYANFRNLVATANVAHHSFAHILAMKARGEETDDPQDKGWNYMKALIRDLGVTDNEEIDKLLGEYPSYYAQMEVLTKKIYQDPDFYTNLYDKPQNVRRINASLDAIKLMQTRDRFEASLRREILVSTLLEQSLEREVKRINAALQNN